MIFLKFKLTLKSLSTTKGTFGMLGSVDCHYFDRFSVRSVLLDVSKAFVKVNYCKLFAELIECKNCSVLLRLLFIRVCNDSAYKSITYCSEWR